MLIKAGVDISRLRPEIRKKLSFIEGTYNGHDNELIVTSTFEGRHSASSLHYANLAIDFRLPDNDRERVISKITSYLGRSFDVCTETDHLHIEYDPK
jgi:hypothetical protein